MMHTSMFREFIFDVLSIATNCVDEFCFERTNLPILGGFGGFLVDTYLPTYLGRSL